MSRVLFFFRCVAGVCGGGGGGGSECPFRGSFINLECAANFLERGGGILSLLSERNGAKKGRTPSSRDVSTRSFGREGGQKRRHELSKQALQWTMPKKELRREADEILIVTPPSTSLRSTPRANHACLFDQGGRKVICFPPPSFPSHVAKIAKIKREEGEMSAHSSEIAKYSQLLDPCKYELTSAWLNPFSRCQSRPGRRLRRRHHGLLKKRGRVSAAAAAARVGRHQKGKK